MKRIIIITIITVINFIFPKDSFAQPLDVAREYEIADSEAQDGDILVFTNEGITRADKAYDPKIFGVLQTTPVIVYRDRAEGKQPVIRSGTASVNVTDAGGAIKKGDYITSSQTEGKGQKSTISGYVLGIALEDLQGSEGKIGVAVKIEYAELTNTRSILRLFDLFNIAASGQDPEQASQLVKYLAAGLIVAAALIISLIIFGRSVTKSIDALGRNPLARTTIQLSLVTSGGIILVVVIIALGAAFIILRL